MKKRIHDAGLTDELPSSLSELLGARDRESAVDLDGPPNGTSKDAVLGDLHPLWERPEWRELRVPIFSSDNEELSLWREFDRDYFLVTVDPTTKQSRSWRTLGECLRIAIALTKALEFFPEHVSYYWIHGFDPKRPIGEQQFDQHEEMPHNYLQRGLGWPISEIYYSLPIIDLLLRDRTFFRSAQQLVDSFKKNWFCIICETQSEECRKHPRY